MADMDDVSGARRSFLDARRRASRERHDERYSAVYDESWGEIEGSQHASVMKLLEGTRAVGTVLDAPCGTGKYWPLILGSGRTVVGVDHSSGMLLRAAEKHPEVPTGRMAE